MTPLSLPAISFARQPVPTPWLAEAIVDHRGFERVKPELSRSVRTPVVVSFAAVRSACHLQGPLVGSSGEKGALV